MPPAGLPGSQATTTGQPLQSGQLLDAGAYRVVRPLGKGGMGAVFLVAQTKAFDRLAVVKEVIDYFDVSDPDARQKALERFEAEARILGELKHPGIPDLYAYFTEGGHNYLVMEYIEGQDLSKGLTREDGDTGKLLRGSPLSEERVLHYTIQICEVLEYLAGRQPPVVHNDIKPGNIIVDGHSGRAVLVDFGTAKTRYLRQKGKPDRDKESVYGTVGYAAPELYRGHSEPRSDVYSLAATAYHLLTDDDPRDHPSQYPQLDRMPPRLAAVLRSALASEVADRPTAAAFRQELLDYLAGQTGPLRALTFPDGDAADERDELIEQAVKHWSYASGILADGTLAEWLRRSLHDPAAAQAAESAVRRWAGDPDAALDAFIRQLKPSALPPGKLELRTPTLRLGVIDPSQPIRLQIEIANRGQGYLRGELLSSQPWIQVGAAVFACPPGRSCAVPVEVDATGLEAGKVYLEAITLAPDGGAPEVVPLQFAVGAPQAVPARGRSAGPALRVLPTRIELQATRTALSTPRERIEVENVGGAPARCRVVGIPPWLLVKPESFRLDPGARREVELVGRVDKAHSRKQQATLAIALEGGQGQEVQVSLRIT
jgi:tRNA A-37 threonylcarbamoyl transferase component Bud32